MGGPALIFDHQMVLDDENCTIYIFGGRVLMRYSYIHCAVGSFFFFTELNGILLITFEMSHLFLFFYFQH